MDPTALLAAVANVLVAFAAIAGVVFTYKAAQETLKRAQEREEQARVHEQRTRWHKDRWVAYSAFVRESRAIEYALGAAVHECRDDKALSERVAELLPRAGHLDALAADVELIAGVEIARLARRHYRAQTDLLAKATRWRAGHMAIGQWMADNSVESTRGAFTLAARTELTGEDEPGDH